MKIVVNAIDAPAKAGELDVIVVSPFDGFRQLRGIPDSLSKRINGDSIATGE